MNTKSPRRIAVFSDIHGNLHALDAVLEAIDQLQIATLACCGDVVGYGAFPNECVERLRFRRIPTVAGNHDHAAIGLTSTEFFNETAKEAIGWTRERLAHENARWLRELPFTFSLSKEFFAVHASPYQPEQWGYVLTFGDARLAFEQFAHRFCFIGHSHQPALVVQNGKELDSLECTQSEIKPKCRYLVNVGSVGQPRDRIPQAAFVTVDLDEGEIQFHRVAYDIRGAQEAIRQSGLPEELAERLKFGW